MTVKVRDRKRLWGRAAGKCSICKIALATETEIGSGLVIGEEAHIVARQPDGPRGESSLPVDQRDAYSNLILLCPTDHARIDDRQSGPTLYPSEKLLELKQEHENKMSELGESDKGKQGHEEKWGQIIDELGARLHWDSWGERFSGVFNADGPTLRADFVNDLSAAAEWIISRVWPDGHPYLRETIKHHNWVLIDFLQEFDKHAEYHPAMKNVLQTDRFYRIRNWDHQEYSRLLNEYDFHISLVWDLGFELTRYGNLIADIVRREIEPFSSCCGSFVGV